jgi:hypothetical protein
MTQTLSPCLKKLVPIAQATVDYVKSPAKTDPS